MNNAILKKKHPVVAQRTAKIALAIALLTSVKAFAQDPLFNPGNLVVTVEGCGVHGGTCTAVPSGTGNGSLNSSVGGYGDNQAGPLTLFQYALTGTTSASFVGSLVLPQTASGANFPVSGEYGSSSEGTLQLSGAGQYLTLMGYGINAATFDAAYFPPFSSDPYGAAPSGALAQSGSLTGQAYTAVPRVLALIDANGNVNSATALYNIFDTNNPRSVYTVDGTSVAYVSGQGSGCDSTGGVFLTPIGAVNNSPTAITGLDAAASSSCTAQPTISQDTRDVQIVSNTLYISVDSKEGSGSNRSYIGTLGTAGTPPTATVGGPVMLNSFGNSGGTGKETITTGANSNGNGPNAGLQINLSPVNYFFANAATLYVADSGNPKNNSATSSLGDGGLQKWINSKSNGSGTWSLAYTLYQNLGLVANSSASGSTGLYGLTGKVTGTTVQLYATNYNINDLDPTYLFGITDTLSFTTASQAASEVFSVLDTAPPDSNFKGVAFAPTIPAGGVEITSTPSGLAFTSSGTGCAPGSYTTPQAPTWTPGNICTLSVVTPQNGPAGVQYVFTQWADGTTTTSDTVTAPASPATYTAEFATLSVQSTGLVYSRVQKRGTETVTITNSGGSTLPGPVLLVLSGLPVGVTAVNNTGTFGGNPYWTVSAGSLAPGASAPVTVTLGYAIGTNVTATSSVYSGSLP